MLALLLALHLAADLPGSEPPLDPFAAVSPGGTCELRVDPGDPEGSGPARYALVRGGRTVWEGERPFTLAAVCVGEDGLVVGLARTRGRDGSMEDRLAVLDERGSAVRSEAFARPRPGSRSGEVPVAVALDGAGDRFLVEVLAWEGTRLCVHRASDGARLGEAPADAGAAELLAQGATERLLAVERVRARERRAQAPASAAPPLPPLPLELLAEVALERPPAFAGGTGSARAGRGATIARDGRLLCLDAAGAVHAWDAGGAHLASSAPIRGGERGLGPIVVDPEGAAWVRRGVTGAYSRVRWIGDGGHGAVDPFHAPRRADGWGWDVRGGLRRLDPTDSEATRIDRLPDGRWVDAVSGAGAFEDGAVALAARGVLALYDARGAPLRAVPLPAGGAVSAAGGRILIDAGAHGRFLADRAALALARLALPRAEGPVALSPDGSEAWALEGRALVLRRYALP